jgi:hypothetical protein
MECVLNLWQLLKQRDLTARTLERRQIWIEQSKSANTGRPRVAIVTGKYERMVLFIKDLSWERWVVVEECLLFFSPRRGGNIEIFAMWRSINNEPYSTSLCKCLTRLYFIASFLAEPQEETQA